MRGTLLILFSAALPALAQVAGFDAPSASPQPRSIEVFRKIYSPQGQAAPLASFDHEVDEAWTAALAAGPLDPFFESAAQQAAQYFRSQGYDRKAETIVHQAISAAQKADAAKARSLRLLLVQHLTQEEKFLAAAGLVEEVIKEIKAAPDQGAPAARISAMMQLAQLREQMGEYEAAEALLLEAKTLQLAPLPQASSFSNSQFGRAAYPGFAAFRMGSFAGIHAGPADLVGFYQRRGEAAKAEALLRKEIDAAKAPHETHRALQNYVHFLNSQQRWEESIPHLEKLIAMQSASSRPEERQMLAASRQNLAQTLAMTGKPDKALEAARENITQSSGDASQHSEALRFYAQMLIQQKQFEEAEKVVEQLRQPVGKNAAELAKYAPMMADQLLANIRQIQNRTEEATALRARAMSHGPMPEGAAVPVWNLLQPVQQLLARHKYTEAMTEIQRILAEAAPRIRSNPEEVNAFANVVHQIPQGRQEERQQLLHAIIATLDGITPADHPRIARALGQLVGSTMHAGLSTTELKRLIDREEKILIAAKGEDSPALNDISRQRAQLFSFRGDYADAAADLRRAVKRSEAASGPKSNLTLQMMRELTNALQATSDNWAEEESIRLAIIERSGQSAGMSGLLAQDMGALAGRYFAVGQRENAVAWMDKAIELTGKQPQLALQVQHLQQQRDFFANAQNQPQPTAGPFVGPGPFYGAGGARWFDPSSSTHGTLLGNRPVPASMRSVGITPAPPPPQPAK